MRTPFWVLYLTASVFPSFSPVTFCYDESPWQPVLYDYYHIDLGELGGHHGHGAPTPDHGVFGNKVPIPRDVIVDVINDLGIKLLAIHNEHNENNIAISPYGAFSVLAALSEGLQGDSAHEILHAAHIPKDKHIVRVGLRDIHRHLKSYFIPEEGFLAGLTLNLNNVSLRSEYEDVLHFYGFDYGSFNNALYPEPPTTKKPAEGTTLETGLGISEDTTVVSTQKIDETTTEIVNRLGGSSSEKHDTTTESESTITTLTTLGNIEETTLATKQQPTPTPTITTEKTTTIIATTTKPVTFTSTQTTTEMTSTLPIESTTTSVTTTLKEFLETTKASVEKIDTTTIDSTTEAASVTTPATATTVIQSTTEKEVTSTKFPETTTNIPDTTSILPETSTIETSSAIKEITTIEATKTTTETSTSTTITPESTTVPLTTTTRSEVTTVLIETTATSSNAITFSTETTTTSSEAPTVLTETATTSSEAPTVSTETATTSSEATTVSTETATTSSEATTASTETVTGTVETTIMNGNTLRTTRQVPVTMEPENQLTTLTSTETTVTPQTTLTSNEITTIFSTESTLPTQTEVVATMGSLEETLIPEFNGTGIQNEFANEPINTSPEFEDQTQETEETSTPFFFGTTPEFQDMRNLPQNQNNFDFNYNYDANNVPPVYDDNTLNSNAMPNPPEGAGFNNNFKRSARSVVDYVIARFFDDHHQYAAPPRRPQYVSPEPLTFAVYGKYRESGINFMKYDTVLPYFFVHNLNALALSFPLDSSKYYLLLLLPLRDNGVDQLICDLRLHGNLRYIIDNLRLTRVVATIPSFMLKGYVTLTPALQRLGIRKIFEPRQADFSPMTNVSDIYVTNIEQAVTVTIRNYLDPSAERYKNFRQYTPVHFKADHPFLYFVIDSELHVALMVGKVINPLNSRII